MKSARSILILGCALMCSCADRPKPITLDEVGKQFVFLGLELGEYDETYIDSYVGPAEWQKRAQEEVRSKAELAQAAADLLTTVESFEPASEEQANRQRLLNGKVRAMEARTRMLLGEKFSFAEEARLLFDANPSQADFSDFDRVLAEIESMLCAQPFLSLKTNLISSYERRSKNAASARLGISISLKMSDSSWSTYQA